MFSFFYLDAGTQPLIVLLDSHQEAVAKKTGAVTNYLAYALIEHATPILVNGAVFHNFLLLQKKGNERLDQLPYPTIEKLCQSIQKSKERSITSTQETISYLSEIRLQFLKNYPEVEALLNGSRIENAEQELLRLIPDKPVTAEINEADFQIYPVVNQFLEAFQNEYGAALKKMRGTVTYIKHLQNNYEMVLNTHLKEIKNLAALLQKHLSLLIEAHNLLQAHLFEYVYRFAKVSPKKWRIYFQKKTDLYLLVPKEQVSLGIDTKELASISWDSSSEALRMISDHAASAQGLYSLYQRDIVSPLENIDQFFQIKENQYLYPLDLFVVGHGDKQSSVEEYINQITLMESRIKQTLATLQVLKNNCEVQLSELIEKPMSEVITQLTSSERISSATYKIMAKEVNKKFIDGLHKRNKNPLKSDAVEVENFLIKEYHHLNQNEVEIEFFWKFISKLEKKYQKAANLLFESKNKASVESLVKESAHLAGLTTSQLTSFIESSAEKKRIKMIYFFTCFGGGKNRLIFEQAAKILNQNEDFKVDLAVGALTDASVPSLIPTLSMFSIDDQAEVAFRPPLSFKTFFEKKLSIESLEAITVGQKYEQNSSVQEYFHGVADFPWKYNHQTEKLELINLKGLVLNLTSEEVARLQESKNEVVVTDKKVILVHQQENEISLVLSPEDRLLPLIVSSQTDQRARFAIKELKCSSYTLYDVLFTSIAHLRQSKEYEITIESLVCAGINKKMKEPLLLQGVTIKSDILPEVLVENEKEKPVETGIIYWNVSIESAPAQSGIASVYRYKDFYNKENQRIFTPLG